MAQSRSSGSLSSPMAQFMSSILAPRANWPFASLASAAAFLSLIAFCMLALVEFMRSPMMSILFEESLVVRHLDGLYEVGQGVVNRCRYAQTLGLPHYGAVYIVYLCPPLIQDILQHG